ncbi:MAG: GAF domain-containing protein, partial [Anaerolineae bacterium]|nr:GAF domain-containing protein [Anaerolineae bacterium]
MSQPNNPSPVTGTIQELRQAKTLVEQVAAALKSQKEILKQRGLNLPPMVLTELSSVQSSLNQLETVLVEEQVELSQLRALGGMSAQITTTLDVDTVLQEAMEIVIVLTRAERGYIALIDPVTGAVEFRVSHDDSLGRGASADEEPQISRTILNEVFTTRQPLLTDNAFKDDRLQGNESIVSYTLRSVLCVPLMYKDALLGAVYVDNRLQAGL